MGVVTCQLFKSAFRSTIVLFNRAGCGREGSQTSPYRLGARVIQALLLSPLRASLVLVRLALKLLVAADM